MHNTPTASSTPFLSSVSYSDEGEMHSSGHTFLLREMTPALLSASHPGIQESAVGV